MNYASRRGFLLATGVLAATRLARAQQAEQPKRVTMLLARSENDPGGQALAMAFRRAMQDLGWIEGRNIRIDARWSAGEQGRAQALAAELVALAPDATSRPPGRSA